MFNTICLSREMNFTLKVIKTAVEVGGIYLFWIVLHFAAANMYVEFCTHLSFTGFLQSPFLATAPHCVAMRWVISTGGNVITQMWCVFGTWLVGRTFSRYFMANDNDADVKDADN